MVEVINETDFELTNEIDFVNLAKLIFEDLKVDSKVCLNIVFVDEETSEKMHLDWMNLPGPTDVLSFPVDEITPGFVAPKNLGVEQPVLGDIAICPVVAENQAKDSGHTAHEEMLLLTTHGILHLLGYDHENVKEKDEMFDLQRKLLIKFIALKDSIPISSVKIEGLPE